MLQRGKRFSIGLVSLFACASLTLTGCGTAAAPQLKNSVETPGLVPAAKVPPMARWLLGEQADTHYTKSCPSGTPFIAPESIKLNAQPVELNNVSNEGPKLVSFLKSADLSGIEYEAGYHLTSDDPRLGGISGIDTLASGDLLAVTDQGDFLWVGMDEFDNIQPVSLLISPMKSSNGQVFDSKQEADAEGLTVDNGLALVSFEQTHRVEAFDLETCGGNARASRVFDLDKKRHNVEKISMNGGMEALTLTADGGLILGVETLKNDSAQISISPESDFADFKHLLNAGGKKKMTGADYLALDDAHGELYSLHRHYSPLSGTQISLLQTPVTQDSSGEYQLGASKELVSLKPPGITDNFEGIAVRREDDGQIRLFIVSDDNFSPKQRSLLLIFNILPDAIEY